MTDEIPVGAGRAVRRTEVEEALTIAAVAEDLFARPRPPREQALALRSIIDAGKGLPVAKLEQVKAHLLGRAERVEAETEWLEEVEVEGVLSDAFATDTLRDALASAAEALRLTAEYVGPGGLPADEGWSWWEALVQARDVLGWDVLPANWRTQEPGPIDPADLVEPEPTEPDDGRAARRTAAVDEVVEPPPTDVDLEGLRDRVRGTDDDG